MDLVTTATWATVRLIATALHVCLHGPCCVSKLGNASSGREVRTWRRRSARRQWRCWNPRSADPDSTLVIPAAGINQHAPARFGPVHPRR